MGKNERQRPTPLDLYQSSVGLRLGVSYVAEQAYCEKRVDLWLQDPGNRLHVPRHLQDVEDPEAAETVKSAEVGVAVHETLLGDLLVPEGARLRDVLDLRGQRPVAELSLEGSYGRLGLVGKPDLVFVGGGQASMIVELKVTPNKQRQQSHVTQLLLYGYLLEQNGADCRNLMCCATLVHPQEGSTTKEEVLTALTRIDARRLRARSEKLRSKKPQAKSWSDFHYPLAPGLEATLRVFPYDPKKAREGELRFFSRYWRGVRPAKPTTKPEKCASCLYNREGLCDESAGPYKRRRKTR